MSYFNMFLVGNKLNFMSPNVGSPMVLQQSIKKLPFPKENVVIRHAYEYEEEFHFCLLVFLNYLLIKMLLIVILLLQNKKN